MQPVELCVLGVPEGILLYLIWIVENGTSFIQHGFPVIQYKMPLSLMDIDDLKFSSAVPPVYIQIPAAVDGYLAAVVNQKRKIYIVIIKILVI